MGRVGEFREGNITSGRLKGARETRNTVEKHSAVTKGLELATVHEGLPDPEGTSEGAKRPERELAACPPHPCTGASPWWVVERVGVRMRR